MADNTTLNLGTGGDTVAMDDIAGVKHQRVKIEYGADGAATDVSTAAPLPVIAAANSGVDIGDVTINNGVGASAVPIQDGGNSLTVDNGGTFAVQASVAAGATTIAKAEDDASANADVGVPAMMVRKATPANTSGTDGDYEFLQGSAGRLWASATIDAALPAGTNAIGKLAANDGVDIGDVTINNGSAGNAVNIQDGGNSITVDGTVTASNTAGDVAHDAGDSGNPVKIGAIARNADQTAVANTDRTNLIADLLGKLITLPYALPQNFVSGATSDITGTTATTVVAAAGAGLKNYITHILVQNSHATVSTWVNITEETSGAILYTVYAPAAGGGASVTLPVPIVHATANRAIQATCVTTGANVRVSASGYKAP